MPRCSKCGKRFQTLQALNDHFRTVHPNERFVAPRSNTSRNLVVAVVVVLIVIGSLVGYLIYIGTTSTTTTTTSSGIYGTPISSALFNNLTSVSFSTLSAVGRGASAVTAPISITDAALTNNGKPEILYIGAEFCPYCAAERWSLVVALSKFGNFTNLEYMASAVNDQNISTVSFRDSTYSSQYLSFVTVENEDRNRNALQQTSSSEQALWDKYNANSYPFIDIGGKYILKSSQFPYSDLSGLTWTQIGSALNNPSSSIAKEIDGAANYLITDFCKIDGGAPSTVCGQSFANVSFSPLSTPSSYLQVITIQSRLSPVGPEAANGKIA